MQAAVADGNLTGATQLWSDVEETVEAATDDVDFYNVLLHNVEDESSSSSSSAAGATLRSAAGEAQWRTLPAAPSNRPASHVSKMSEPTLKRKRWIIESGYLQRSTNPTSTVSCCLRPSAAHSGAAAAAAAPPRPAGALHGH